MEFKKIFTERYERLNNQQRQAVDTIDGPVMVIAGPGSGKTEILGLRVANILRTADVNPSNILCLTFTDAAAVNMRERLASLIGPEAYRVAIHTFHSFGQRIIEENPTCFFGSARFSAVDELVQFEVIQEILRTLPNDNPLISIHPEQGYVYLKDLKSAISNLKRAAITPNEFERILAQEQDFYEYVRDDVNNTGSKRVNAKDLTPWLELSIALGQAAEAVVWIDDFYPHPALSLKNSLDRAISESETTGKGTPLSNWKKDSITKDGDTYLLKDDSRHEKMTALSDIYKQYENSLHQSGYFDFDDMLVAVVNQLRTNDQLLYEVSEKYSYILIDEFQDTNDAQLKLALTIARPELFEGRPNLMAVGDDDQAINRFQGADISNIRLFINRMPETEFIVLTKNYRSHQDIIDLAKSVIRQGQDRLENIIEEIDKELVAANKNITDVDIKYHQLPSQAHEFNYIAIQIRNLIDKGVDPSTIAVLGREHRQLQALVTHLHDHRIPVRYERNLDVLKQKHIRELIQMARYVYSISNPAIEVADELLPEILSYDFWQLDRLSVWKLGRYAYDNRVNWHTAMVNSDDKKIVIIADFLARLAEVSMHEPMEVILDHLIGSTNGLLTYDDTDEYTPGYKTETLVPDWHSPFKGYYFGDEIQKEKRSLYVAFLSNLRVFVSALREYKQRDFTKLSDLVMFVELHDQYGKLVADTSPFVSAEKSVHVMTAHKSKGLEFDTVFVINCVDEVWAKTRSSSKLSFPGNLPIEPSGTTQDDNLRLFFVAITRAARNLYLSSYQFSDTGKDINEVRFLSNIIGSSDTETLPEAADILKAEMHVWHALPPTPSEDSYLRELVEDYQLSVTHLNTFLDITRGGPQTFFEQNLLRFPQGKTPASAYGSAIHSCIEQWWRKYTESAANTIPTLESLIKCFDEGMDAERLASHEIARLRDRGRDALKIFYKYLAKSANPNDLIEKNFRHEGVVIDGISLTGKIDRIILDRENQSAIVSDFKTGGTASTWKASGYEAIKLHNYKRQLIFYKILMNNSSSFKNVTVNLGQLEFVEPDNKGSIIVLETALYDGEVERVCKLIAAVGHKIKTLDFPDVSSYPQTLKGIIEFEDNLLN